MRRASESSDLAKLATTITNYRFKFSFTNRLPHLVGEEVFGSMKQLATCPPIENNDSHCRASITKHVLAHFWVLISTIELTCLLFPMEGVHLGRRLFGDILDV
jgi:hypothetical protein